METNRVTSDRGNQSGGETNRDRRELPKRVQKNSDKNRKIVEFLRGYLKSIFVAL